MYRDSRPDPAELESTVNEFLELFNENEENQSDEDEPVVDEEGFTLVKTKKRKRLALRTAEAEGELESKRAKKLQKLDDAGTVPLSFYRFSRKNAKKEQIESLKSRFQQDRANLKQVLQARKFRPQ
jgi:hypothetical protein